MNELETFFADCAAKVDRKLDNLAPSSEIEPTKLHEAVRWSLFAGGKRFRPALLIAVGQTFGAAADKLLTAAAAIEMIHTYSLVHDDLPQMDDDDLRRGRATCHKKFGEATAILAGDVLQTLAFQAIGEAANLTAELRVELISEIARAAGTPHGMVAGQQLDLEAEGRKISIEQLEKIHHRKTGALICAAARSGAIIAGASRKEIEIIAGYAAELGLLFQITDDLLDVTQTSEILGKTAGKDALAEKATYPAFYGLEKTAELAADVHARACLELGKLKTETTLLEKIADFILNRRK